MNTHHTAWKKANAHHGPVMCQGCGLRLAADIHHLEYKGMGGRKGAAKVAINQASNLIALCRVCHGASHGRREVEPDGFSCSLCRKRDTCRFGLQVRGKSYTHVPPPWILN
jgi:hypothetical protein